MRIVYIVIPVEFDPEEGDIWGYIYKNEENLTVHSSLKEATSFIKEKCLPIWNVSEHNICFERDDEDSSLYYIWEKENENTPLGDAMWAVIIERDFGG